MDIFITNNKIWIISFLVKYWLINYVNKLEIILKFELSFYDVYIIFLL